MPGVACQGCGRGTNVSFRRGTRLADIPCPYCQKQELKLPTAGRPSPNAGRKYEHCAKCGKRGLHHVHPLFDWTPKYGTGEVFSAGTPCCVYHEPVPAARTAHATVHGSLTTRLGPRRPGLSCWATKDERAALERLAATQPQLCHVCADAGLPQHGFHTQAYGFTGGIALVAVCEGCGDTILLASGTAQARSGGDD